MADDWYTTFHTGLAAECWRAAATMADALEGAGFADIELLGPDGTEPFALGDRRLVIRAQAA